MLKCFYFLFKPFFSWRIGSCWFFILIFLFRFIFPILIFYFCRWNVCTNSGSYFLWYCWCLQVYRKSCENVCFCTDFGRKCSLQRKEKLDGIQFSILIFAIHYFLRVVFVVGNVNRPKSQRWQFMHCNLLKTQFCILIFKILLCTEAAIGGGL